MDQTGHTTLAEWSAADADSTQESIAVFREELGHAWAIPELYAARGAKVLRSPAARDQQAEAVALGLLGDLLDHRERDFARRTGLVIEPGELGIWLLAPSGAILIRPGGRRAHS